MYEGFAKLFGEKMVVKQEVIDEFLKTAPSEEGKNENVGDRKQG